MINSNDSLFQVARELMVSLDKNGHAAEALVLEDGFNCLNGLTDGWALFLDAIKALEKKSGSFSKSEQKSLTELHDAVHYFVYRRKWRWWKFWCACARILDPKGPWGKSPGPYRVEKKLIFLARALAATYLILSSESSF